MKGTKMPAISTETEDTVAKPATKYFGRIASRITSRSASSLPTAFATSFAIRY